MELNVQPALTARAAMRLGRIPTVALMLSLWLGTLALAASPQLHRLLHKDAQSLNHQCLITHIKQHSLLAGSPTVLAPTPSAVDAGFARSADPQFFPTSHYRFSPSRAPPAVFSSKTVVG